VRDAPAKGRLREQEAVEGGKIVERVKEGQGSDSGVVSGVTMVGALSL
jgi:hypothetical protein